MAEQKKKSFWAPSKFKAVLIYVIVLFLLSSLFSVLSSVLYGSIHGYQASEIMNSYFSKGEVSDEIAAIKIVGQGWGNFISYFLAFAAVAFFMRDEFVKDFKMIREHKVKYAIFIPVAAVIFAVLAIGIDHVFSRFSGDSENQQTIVKLLSSPAAVPMVIATILFAPVVEECIYRKTIFSCLRLYNPAASYIASIALFTLPHMLTTSTSLLTWVLQCIPYALCGAMLCVIYHKSNHNIYASVAAHMLNNILAVLFVFLNI